jgi:hypothetical protein
LQKALKFVFEIGKENTCFLPAVVDENTFFYCGNIVEIHETRAKNNPTM